MKKSTLILLLQNIYEDAETCNCYPIKRKIEFLIEKVNKEGVENDDQ
ncbi:hypothetical protein Stok01_02489 [Sulfurisphaera tokodaii]|nr:hypothetical protein [Sulfurisphaera tokodaii]